MKNLKTIVAFLLLTVMTFSCQTNDELETLEEINSSSNRNITSLISTSSLYIEYADGLAEYLKDYIRGEFEQGGINFISVDDCTVGELWIVEELSYNDFLSILEDLEFVPIPNAVSVKNADDYPIPLPYTTQYFKIFYNHNCNGRIN